jgi:hypothetical protein
MFKSIIIKPLTNLFRETKMAHSLHFTFRIFSGISGFVLLATAFSIPIAELERCEIYLEVVKYALASRIHGLYGPGVDVPGSGLSGNTCADSRSDMAP